MDDRPGAGDDAADPEDPTTGEPVADLLEQLDDAPRTGFVEGVRRRIHRKAFAGQVVELLWSTPALVLGEWLEMLLSWMHPEPKKSEGGTKDE